MAKLYSLSDENVAHLRSELAAGREPTVWFTPGAVSVTAGSSGKVVALAEPAEGDFIQVRPAGSRDKLSFSPAELTLTRPPRKKPTAPVEQPDPTLMSPPSAADDASPGTPEPAAASALPPATATDGGATSGESDPVGTRTASSGGARKQLPPQVTVTLSGSPDGDWTVEVMAGAKRTVRATPVPASAVARAAQHLHPEIVDAVADVLEGARTRQREKVENLRAELEAAQQELSALER